MNRVGLARIKSSPKSTNRAQVPRLLPFGPPPLLDGEDGAAYDELLAQISAAVKPADILEEIWVRDTVDLTWEVLRLRRLKVNMVRSTARDSLVRALVTALESPVCDSGRYAGINKSKFAEALAYQWAMREPDAVKLVEEILALAKLSINAVIADGLSESILVIERIDRMIAMAEGRRNAMLREIDRHRSAVGTALRQTVTRIEDGEYHVNVEAPDRNKTP